MRNILKTVLVELAGTWIQYDPQPLLNVRENLDIDQLYMDVQPMAKRDSDRDDTMLEFR